RCRRHPRRNAITRGMDAISVVPRFLDDAPGGLVRQGRRYARPDLGDHRIARSADNFMDFPDAVRWPPKAQLPPQGCRVPLVGGAQFDIAGVARAYSAQRRRAVAEAEPLPRNEVDRARRQAAARTEQRVIDGGGDLKLGMTLAEMIDTGLHRPIGD